MKLRYLKKKKELIPVALLALSALLIVIILAKVTSLFTASANAENIVRRAAEYSETNDEDMKKYFAKSKTLADELKKNNLFIPPSPKRHPINEVIGILGDEVLINNRWYKEGARVGDAKIVAIGPTKVTIEWGGKSKDFAPLDSKGSSGPGGPKGRRPPSAGTPPGGADMVVISPPSGPTGMPAGVREVSGPRGGMRGRFFGNMSDEERERFMAEMRERRARFENMSPAERERFRNEMRERFGGGMMIGGGMPGGGRGQGGGRRGER
jgi:hypothetical protein